MSKCPFYQVHMHRPSPASSDSGSQVTHYQPYPWCSHERSPVSVRSATQASGEHKLKCAGDLTKCQVAEQWRPKREEP